MSENLTLVEFKTIKQINHIENKLNRPKIRIKTVDIIALFFGSLC